MKKVEHIGIAVKDLKSANELYRKLLGEAPYKTESVASEMVNTSFFKTGDTKIELLESTSPDSAINTFIEKRGEGIHHIAFEVDDIRAEMKRLKEAGFKLTRDANKGPTLRGGSTGKKKVVLHDLHQLLVQLAYFV